jgi:hypothetical protein
MLDIYLAAGMPVVEPTPLGIDLVWSGRDGQRVTVSLKRKHVKELYVLIPAALDESRESAARLDRVADPS